MTSTQPITINRVVFAHGKSFHDGGWFDTDGGRARPDVQVQTDPGGPWKSVGTLMGYPATTATNSVGIQNGQKFEVKFAATRVVGIRVIGKPASGDNPKQAFSSCAELQGYLDKK